MTKVSRLVIPCLLLVAMVSHVAIAELSIAPKNVKTPYGPAPKRTAGQTAHRAMTGDQQALKELVDEATLGGRKPLSVSDADTILDWAQEYNYPGVRASPGDVGVPSNWTANPQPHIHIPGAGRGGHVPDQPGVQPR